MWLSGQYKRPAEQAEGQTGVVTVGGGGTAVLLDRERCTAPAATAGRRSRDSGPW